MIKQIFFENCFFLFFCSFHFFSQNETIPFCILQVSFPFPIPIFCSHVALNENIPLHILLLFPKFVSFVFFQHLQHHCSQWRVEDVYHAICSSGPVTKTASVKLEINYLIRVFKIPTVIYQGGALLITTREFLI